MAMELARKTLEPAFLLSPPILVVALVMGLLATVLGVMTPVQDITNSTIGRLFAVALTTFLLLLLSFQKLMALMSGVLSDLRRYVG
jgi:flagellar biosynthesis protein FliQ